MSEGTKLRKHWLDPDFRPTPKTERYCCVCYRDLSAGSGQTVRIDAESGMWVIHPEDASAQNSVEALVGADCAKKIPTEFISNPPKP
jgi:hypothetical protein